MPPRTLSTELLSVIHEYSYTRLCFAPVIIGGNSVHSASVRDLGVWIDRGLSMSTHVTKVVAGCFAVLRQLNSIRRSVSRESLIGLVVSLVLIRLDYCNARPALTQPVSWYSIYLPRKDGRLSRPICYPAMARSRTRDLSITNPTP